MGHPLQQDTHVAYFYRRAASTTTVRGEPIEGEWGEYTNANVRLTDGGGGFAQVVGGNRDDENPIITGPARLAEGVGATTDAVATDDRVALDGAGYVFDATAPADGDWFRITNTTLLLAFGSTPRGIEMTLTKVS